MVVEKMTVFSAYTVVELNSWRNSSTKSVECLKHVRSLPEWVFLSLVSTAVKYFGLHGIFKHSIVDSLAIHKK